MSEYAFVERLMALRAALDPENSILLQGIRTLVKDTEQFDEKLALAERHAGSSNKVVASMKEIHEGLQARRSPFLPSSPSRYFDDYRRLSTVLSNAPVGIESVPALLDRLEEFKAHLDSFYARANDSGRFLRLFMTGREIEQIRGSLYALADSLLKSFGGELVDGDVDLLIHLDVYASPRDVGERLIALNLCYETLARNLRINVDDAPLRLAYAGTGCLALWLFGAAAVLKALQPVLIIVAEFAVAEWQDRTSGERELRTGEAAKTLLAVLGELENEGLDVSGARENIQEVASLLSAKLGRVVDGSKRIVVGGEEIVPQAKMNRLLDSSEHPRLRRSEAGDEPTTDED